MTVFICFAVFVISSSFIRPANLVGINQVYVRTDVYNKSRRTHVCIRHWQFSVDVCLPQEANGTDERLSAIDWSCWEQILLIN